MHIQICIYLSLVFCSIGALSAQDLRGRWSGKIYQGRTGQFACEIRITEKHGNLYRGQAYCQSELGPYRGKVMYEVELEVTDEGILYRDLEVIREQKEGTFFWCLKTGTLGLAVKYEEEFLEGLWAAEGCTSGKIVLSRPHQVNAVAENPEAPVTLAERVVDARYDFAAMTDSIRIEYWDNNQADGDIISLNFNGKWVLRKHRLTAEKGELMLPLTRRENLLVLHAENLGDIPPNTAAIGISNGEQITTIVLNSDQQKSEGIRIKR